MIITVGALSILPLTGQAQRVGWDFNELCLAPLQNPKETIFQCDVALRMRQSINTANSLSEADSLHLGNLYLARANALFFDGAVDASIIDYQRVIDVTDWRASAYAGLGRSLFVQRDDDDAFMALNKAISLTTGYGLAHRYRGLIVLRSGDARRAIEDLQIAARLQPALAENHVLLGIAQLMAGDMDVATRSFDAAQDRQLAWDYLPLWQFLASKRGPDEQRRLEVFLEQLGPGWPAPLVNAFLEPRTIQNLRVQMSDRTPPLGRDEHSALTFYSLLFDRLIPGNQPNLSDASERSPQPFKSVDSTIDRTIEQQLLPALQQHRLPQRQ